MTNGHYTYDDRWRHLRDPILELDDSDGFGYMDGTYLCNQSNHILTQGVPLIINTDTKIKMRK